MTFDDFIDLLNPARGERLIIEALEGDEYDGLGITVQVGKATSGVLFVSRDSDVDTIFNAIDNTLNVTRERDEELP